MALNIHTVPEFQVAFELGLTTHYRDNLMLHDIEYTPWLRSKQATRIYDEEWSTSGLGIIPEKPMGSDIPIDKILPGPRKTHDLKFWAVGVIITYEAMRWALYGLFKNFSAELSKSSVDRYNLVGFGILNESFNGSATTNYLTAYGQSIINAAHTRHDGGTWNNLISGNPGLSYIALQAAITLLKRQVNERGRWTTFKPAHLLVSNQQRWIADTILNSGKRAGTANNDKNTLSGEGISIHDSVFISTVRRWWLKAPKSTEAFQVFMRLGDKPDFVPDSDPRSRNRLMTTYCSFNAVVYGARGIVGSTGGE